MHEEIIKAVVVCARILGFVQKNSSCAMIGLLVLLMRPKNFGRCVGGTKSILVNGIHV